MYICTRTDIRTRLTDIIYTCIHMHVSRKVLNGIRMHKLEHIRSMVLVVFVD
jgi:hypothetical protein